MFEQAVQNASQVSSDIPGIVFALVLGIIAICADWKLNLKQTKK